MDASAQWAKTRYAAQGIDPTVPLLPSLERVPDHIRDYNGRRFGLPLVVVFERIEYVVIGDMSSSGERYPDISAVAIFDETWHHFSPRGPLSLKASQTLSTTPALSAPGDQDEQW